MPSVMLGVVLLSNCTTVVSDFCDIAEPITDAQSLQVDEHNAVYEGLCDED